MVGPDLFETPLSKTKVRKDVYAYAYKNGTININGKKFIGYSIKEAIKIWRKENPIR